MFIKATNKNEYFVLKGVTRKNSHSCDTRQKRSALVFIDRTSNHIFCNFPRFRGLSILMYFLDIHKDAIDTS